MQNNRAKLAKLRIATRNTLLADALRIFGLTDETLILGIEVHQANALDEEIFSEDMDSLENFPALQTILAMESEMERARLATERKLFAEWESRETES